MLEIGSILKKVQGKQVYLVGIKGTGMAALAEILLSRGALVQGSDVSQVFFTDSVLAELKIPVHQGFSENNLGSKGSPLPQLIIYSAAYRLDTHPELMRAAQLKIPMAGYHEALGALSQGYISAGVAGVHGKTTTTALCGVVAQGLGLPATILTGSTVPRFGNRATLNLGATYFIAETCEYRRHFLSFHPSHILLTSVEPDHLDYFTGFEDIQKAFIEYILLLPQKGSLVYCHDDEGARETALLVAKKRPDVILIPYGFTAPGPYALQEATQEPGLLSFYLEGFFTRWNVRVPGEHNMLNAAGAIALCHQLVKHHRDDWGSTDLQWAKEALEQFTGTRRRSELLGEKFGVLVMDDYGHHPTAIRKTIEGIKAFYPDRRLVVDFMSHTYSRTSALLEEFSRSFDSADEVVLHKIFASAREEPLEGINGQTLFKATCQHHTHVKYFEEVMEALPYYKQSLKSGDLLLTMGAGNNYEVAKAWLKEEA